MNQPQPVFSTQGTHRTTLRAHRTPTLTATSPQGKKRKQVSEESSSSKKSLKITITQKAKPSLIPSPSDDRERDEIAKATILKIEKMVKGEEDEESYASEFSDSMFNDDADDSGTRIESVSHKENAEVVSDDVVTEKKDEETNENVEKKDDTVEEKDNDDHIDHTLVGSHATGSMKPRNKQIQTPIPTPPRSPRKESSSDKTISKELTATVSQIAATTSKAERKKGFTFHKTKILPESIAGMSRRYGQIRSHIKKKFVTHDFFMGKIREVLDHCNKVVPELAIAKTNEMIKEEMPRLVHLAVTKDQEITSINVPELISNELATHVPKIFEELFQKHMQNTTLNLYPTTSTSIAEVSTADLQHQLYEKMKSTPQDQIKERVHDFQLGIESYQIKINLTTPRLTFFGIEAHDSYSIVDEPETGLIYLNNKDEKWVMYLVKIVKFCDATLEKVLKEVKLRIFQTEILKKPPLLGEVDLDIMKAFEREINKRLGHHVPMRRWESFVNRRPILPTMKRM
ncbi:hypothetical protein Tco_0360148 [Tanacetum coccineum]